MVKQQLVLMTEDLPYLPYSRQQIDDDDIAAVVAVLKGDFLTSGPRVPEFENALTEACKCSHAIAVSNGTAALHVAYRSMGIGPGDTVIVPSLTFLATANAALFCGADVVLADVDPDSGLITGDTCQEAIDRTNKPPSAIAVVHLGGRLVDMRSIARIAQSQNAMIVEDACHAIGAEWTDEDDGSNLVGACRHSAATVFSFHPIKTITAGEGGAVTYSDQSLAERAGKLRFHGLDRNLAVWRNQDLGAEDGLSNPWYYEMAELGWNYRLTDLQCALASSQIRKLSQFLDRRTQLAHRYSEKIAALDLPVQTPVKMNNQKPGWHLYQVRIDFKAAGISRARVIMALADDGIGAQVHYIPIHLQPYYVDRFGPLELPGAMEFYSKTLSLPLFPAMQNSDVDRVVDKLASILRRA